MNGTNYTPMTVPSRFSHVQVRVGICLAKGRADETRFPVTLVLLDHRCSECDVWL